MAVTAISLDNISIFGDYTTKQIPLLVSGLVPAYDSALAWICGELEAATAAVAQAVADSRGAEEQLHRGAAQKQEALALALDTLLRFSKHLQSHKGGVVYRKRFFTRDGTVKGAEKGGQRNVLEALSHIAGELEKEDSGVRDAVEWHKEIALAAGGLAPLLGHTDTARASQRANTPEVLKARTSWMRVYLASRALCESALRMAGKLELLPQIFHDLAIAEVQRANAARASRDAAE